MLLYLCDEGFVQFRFSILFIFHSIILVLLVVGLFVFMIVYILLLFPTLTLINKLF